MRKELNPALLTDLKGTFWNCSKIVRAVTSVLAGFEGIERSAKSPASRLREADPGSPAVMSDYAERYDINIRRYNERRRERKLTARFVISSCTTDEGRDQFLF